MIDLLAICGSLREVSSNKALLAAAAKLGFAQDIRITLYQTLGDLPLFNPDLEGKEPQSVLRFRSAIQSVKGVLISSPEYAHGITGVLKNALDWTVASGEFVAKPIALLNASGRATIAQHSLKEILTTMDAYIVDDASLTIPLPHNKIDTEGILTDTHLSALLSLSLTALTRAVRPGKGVS